MPGTIDDPIAEDVWAFDAADGTRARARIIIGRPFQDPASPWGDWRCPISIEGWTPGVIPIAGVGPVDALLNAMKLVSTFQDAKPNVAPRSGA